VPTPKDIARIVISSLIETISVLRTKRCYPESTFLPKNHCLFAKKRLQLKKARLTGAA
jgi:hypothetical protein